MSTDNNDTFSEYSIEKLNIDYTPHSWSYSSQKDDKGGLQ